MTIKVKNLTKQYSNIVAIDNLNISIQKGVFGLLGPNGSGKTTLMKVMATIMQPTSGTILLDGYDVKTHPKEVRERIGYLPQDFGFYPNISVHTFLEYVGVLKGLNKYEISFEIPTVLEAVNLNEWRKAKIKTLSTGMLQRLGIAQALLGKPSILIIDEPTSGLDPEERIRFRKIFTEIGINRTVILSTHILGDIEASCDKLCVLNKGKVIYNGSVAGLAEYSQSLIWDLEIPMDLYETIKRKYTIVDTKYRNNKMILKVISMEKPTNGVPVDSNVEYGYFSLLHKNKKI